MLYAVDGSEEKITATPGLRAKCPGCGGEVIAKCGSIVTHHWAHVAQECDSWHEPETEWHRGWKSLFPKECCEVTIGPHRADVKINGTVIEFQKSPISPEEIAEREAFYGDMVWVLDGSDFHKRFRFRKRLEGGAVSFRWYHPRQSWFAAKKPIFIDFSKKFSKQSVAGRDEARLELFGIKKIKKNTPCGGYGKLGTKGEFVDFFANGAGERRCETAEDAFRECSMWLTEALGDAHLGDLNWNHFGRGSGWCEMRIFLYSSSSGWSNRPGWESTNFETALFFRIQDYIAKEKIGIQNYKEKLSSFILSCLPDKLRMLIDREQFDPIYFLKMMRFRTASGEVRPAFPPIQFSIEANTRNFEFAAR